MTKSTHISMRLDLTFSSLILFQRVYAENLVQLYIVVRQCLEQEKEIVSQVSNNK